MSIPINKTTISIASAAAVAVILGTATTVTLGKTHHDLNCWNPWNYSVRNQCQEKLNKIEKSGEADQSDGSIQPESSISDASVCKDDKAIEKFIDDPKEVTLYAIKTGEDGKYTYTTEAPEEVPETATVLSGWDAAAQWLRDQEEASISVPEKSPEEPDTEETEVLRTLTGSLLASVETEEEAGKETEEEAGKETEVEYTVKLGDGISADSLGIPLAFAEIRESEAKPQYTTEGVEVKDPGDNTVSPLSTVLYYVKNGYKIKFNTSSLRICHTESYSLEIHGNDIIIKQAATAE